MPNWVYNRLTVTGDAKNLRNFAEKVGSKGCAINFPKLATVVPRTWDSRDERTDSRVEKIKGGIVYFFDTAWSARPSLIHDLSKAFPILQFELYYIEEVEQFAGCLIFKKGEQQGEAYLGEEELEDFIVPSDEWSEDEDDEEEYSAKEIDTKALEEELHKRARAGGVVDWEARKAKLELLRADAETAALTRIRSYIHDLTSNPKLHLPKKKTTDEALCKAIRGFESNYGYRQHADLDMIPKDYLSEWAALQFCMTNDSNWKKLPKSVQTQSFWDKYIRSKETLSPYYNPPLKKVPKKFRSENLIRYALKNDVDALASLQQSERTFERCKLAVECYSQQLEHVPRALRTAALCQIAVNQDGMSLQFVPKNLRTKSLCELATYKGKGFNAMAIQFVPPNLVTEKMFEFFIQSPRGRVYENSLEPNWIPKVFRNFELLKELLPAQPKLLPIIPDQMLDKFLQIEGYALRLIESSGWYFNWLNCIPEAVRTKELYEYVIQNHGARYYKSLPDQYKTKVLSLEAFHAEGAEILTCVPQEIFDQDFCTQILESDLNVHEWRLNGSPELLKEFVNSIPAKHFPKHVWNDDLITLARKQTKFSELAFPKGWILYENFRELVVQDKNFFFWFDKEVQEQFESEFEVLSELAEIKKDLNTLAHYAKRDPAEGKKISEALGQMVKSLKNGEKTRRRKSSVPT